LIEQLILPRSPKENHLMHQNPADAADKCAEGTPRTEFAQNSDEKTQNGY